MSTAIRLFNRFSLAVILVGCVGLVADASVFTVNPVRIELSAKRPYAVVQITNLSEDSVTVQGHVLVWETHNNQDVFRQTDEVVLNPPIFTLAPQQKQFLRLGLRRPAIPQEEEIAFRLILEEVPEPPAPGFTGLRTILRISIPIFARPESRVSPNLHWQAVQAQGVLHITAANRGNAHVQVKGIELIAEGGAGQPLRKLCQEYLLPSQFRTWTISEEHIRNAARVTLVAFTDAGEIREVLIPKQQ